MNTLGFALVASLAIALGITILAGRRIFLLQRSLATRDREFHALFDHAEDIIAYLDSFGRVLSITPSIRLGRSNEPVSWIGRQICDEAHNEDSASLREAIIGVASRSGTCRNVIYRQRRGDAWSWMETNLRSFQAGNGSVQVILVARDISSRILQEQERSGLTEMLEIRVKERTSELTSRNEQLLQEITARLAAEDRLHMLTAAVEQNSSLVLILDKERVVQYANASFRASTGFADHQIIGSDPFTWDVSPPLGDELTSLWAQVDAGREWQGESLKWNAQGGTFQSWTAISRLKRDDSSLSGYLISILDITARKVAEEEQARLGWVIEQVAEVIMITNREGNIEYVNPAFERITGWTRSEATGKTPAILKSGSHPPEFYAAMWKTISDGKVWTGRLVNRRRDGTLFHEEGTISPVRDGQGRIVKFVAIKRDITHVLELEAKLRQSQKLESIGQLAAGIAHEINTPIQFIGDNVRFSAECLTSLMSLVDEQASMLSSHPDAAIRTSANAAIERADFSYLTKEVPKAIDQTIEGIDRVTTIVRAMKEFSHPGSVDRSPCDLNHMVENAVIISRNTWKYVAEVATELDTTLPLVPLAAGDFNQVLLNLLVNAAQAVEEAQQRLNKPIPGHITIATKRDGDRVILRIQDDGCGIPDSIRERIYDPFFTTKAVGRGTGQGLAITRGVIVERHHGSITCDSTPGSGTTFVITLPLTPQESA